MPTSTSNGLEAFSELEHEMQARFAELASDFDFCQAERRAVDALNEVYRVAEKARRTLDSGIEFEPGHTVIPRKEHEELFAKWMTLECEVRQFFAALRWDASTRPERGRPVSVPGAALQRLWETFEWVRVDGSSATERSDADAGDDTSDDR